MKHPFQLICVKEDRIYTLSKQTLQVFSLETFELENSWNDELDSSYILVKQQQEKIAKLQEAGIDKVPKVPQPGSNAPKINNFIRNLAVNENFVVLTTDTDKLCVILEVGSLKLVKRVELSKRPCSIIFDKSNENILVGDKFGDVYKISLSTHVDSLEPILGHVSMLTSLNNFVKDSQEFIVTTDRDEHIKISNYPDSYIIDTFLFGHLNFISSTVVDNLQMLTGGGDDFICLWDLEQYKLLKKLPLAAIYPDQEEFVVLKVGKFGQLYCLALERSRIITLLDSELNLVKQIELEDEIVDFDTGNSIVVSLANSSICIIDSEFTVFQNTQISTNSQVEIKDDSEIIPLFTVGNLRKYSEKYT